MKEDRDGRAGGMIGYIVFNGDIRRQETIETMILKRCAVNQIGYDQSSMNGMTIGINRRLYILTIISWGGIF